MISARDQRQDPPSAPTSLSGGEASPPASPLWRWFAYLGLALLATLTPRFLARLDLPILGRTSFDLFAGTASLALALIGLYEWRARIRSSWPALAPLLAFLLVAFATLQFITEHSVRDWDYLCYQTAAQDLLAGRNPYQEGNLHSYLYPPLTAQLFAAAWLTLDAGARGLGLHPAPQALWDLLFYFYQCAQLFMVCLLFLLCYRLATRLGLDPALAAAITAALLLVNTPLHRTLKLNQVNLWVLNSVLGAMLLAGARPLAAGLLAAFAGHLKLYPFVLAAPWLLARRWAALCALVAGAALLLLLSTAGGRDWSIWAHWLAFFRAFPVGTRVRDNSLHSLSWNLLLPLKRLLDLPDPSYASVVGLLTTILSLAVLGWFIWRVARRQRTDSSPADLRLLHQSLDLWTATLLLSPVVWEHHYLFALPLVLWAFAWHRHRPWPVILAAALIFWLPTFHLYLLSYHRLAGLLLLFWLTRPLHSDASSAPLPPRA